MKLLLVHFRNIMSAGVLLSLISATISILNGTYATAIATEIIMNIIFLAWIILKMFQFRMSVPGKKLFYLFNYATIAAYSFIPICFSALIHFFSLSTKNVISIINSYTFYNFKFIHFLSFKENTGYTIGITHSAVYYTLILLFVATVFPIFVNKKKIIDNITEPEEESVILSNEEN